MSVDSIAGRGRGSGAETRDAADIPPWRFAAFRRIRPAITASNFASQIQIVAAAWLMASMTGSAQLVAMVQTAVALPVALFVLIGGAVADGGDRRRIMLCAHSFILIVSALLAVSCPGPRSTARDSTSPVHWGRRPAYRLIDPMIGQSLSDGALAIKIIYTVPIG